MGWLSNFAKSFKKGGATPFEAFFYNVPYDQDLSINELYDIMGSQSWVNYDLDNIDSSSDVQDPLNQFVEEVSSSLTPNVSQEMDTSYLDEILNKVQSAYDNMYQQSVISSERAMEFSADQAQLNRDFNAAQAQLNRDFQTEMSNTAYQRAMSDMQKAGLNPKLVAQIGGSSTPSGSVASSGSSPSGVYASVPNYDISAVASIMNSYINSANKLDSQQNDFVHDIVEILVNNFTQKKNSTTVYKF